MSEKIDIGAYIWPSCHNDPRGQEVLWPEGTGEWEIIKKGTPRFPGHYQPKLPLWGYESDDDPKIMERWINAAVSHSVNLFIFDWYWYDNKPFLESTLDNGFLKAGNSGKMQFYVMWANHDVPKNYWNVYKYKDDNSLLWKGAVSLDEFETLTSRVTEKYFKLDNYYKIDGNPVFSVFSLNNLIEGLGGLKETKDALNRFRKKVRNAGFRDLHLQTIVFGEPDEETVKKIELLGFNSATCYNWGQYREDYLKWGTEAMQRIENWETALNIPFITNVSIGYDDTPRFPSKGEKDVVHFNKSPVSFSGFLLKAKEKTETKKTAPRLITLFAWNEWVEGAYLLPDVKYGYGYLEAVKSVIKSPADN